MSLQLNGYTVEINELYASKVYEGLLCGVIDTIRNDAEELKAKEKLETFTDIKDVNLFLAPIQRKRIMSSFSNEDRKIVEEDFFDAFYSANRYTEERLDNFWIVAGIVSRDGLKKHRETDDFCSILNVVFNFKNFDIDTIEQYLYENLPIEIWNIEARNYTP